MASIRKFQNKDGTISYQIRVYRGKDINGKQLKPFTTTFNPELGWSEKTALKKANEYAVMFEHDCKAGLETDERVTFQEYADYVINMKRANGTLKHTTEVRYRDFTKRLYPIMGYMKVKDIRPAFLNKLYAELLETPVEVKDKAVALPRFKVMFEDSGLSKDKLSKNAGISHDTLNRALAGNAVHFEKAEQIAKALDTPVRVLFKMQMTTKTLAPKTVMEYHRFISSILAQAEKEMIVPYNMASRATPPHLRKKEVNYFQPETIKEIEAAFDNEDELHRMIGYMFIFTGARRGEIMGLEWHNVDFDKNTIKIEKNVLYTPERGVYADTPKTETSIRTIGLPQIVMDMLKEYKVRYDTLRKGLSWKYKADNDFIFVRENGQPINPDTISGWLKRIEANYQLPHLNSHAFRHSVASALIFHGVDPVTVSKRLGHNQVSTTTNIYSHIMSEAEEKNAEILTEIFV